MSVASAVRSPRTVADQLMDGNAWPLVWGQDECPLTSRVPYRGRHTDPYASVVERFLVTVPRRAFTPDVPDPVRTGPLPPGSAGTAPNPHAVYHAKRTLTLVLEVWTQRRPPTHLDRLLDPSAARYIHVVGLRLKAREVRSARLCSMRICHPHPDAAEVAAVCLIGRRPRAVAARFERSAEGPAWRCRTLQLG